MKLSRRQPVILCTRGQMMTSGQWLSLGLGLLLLFSDTMTKAELTKWHNMTHQLLYPFLPHPQRLERVIDEGAWHGQPANRADLLLPLRVKKPLVEAHQHQIYSDVDAIAGQLTRLPCFVRSLGPFDSISLVLWYHGEDISGSPIYSVDARYSPLERAHHFVHKDYQHKQVMNFTLGGSKHELSETNELGGLNSPEPTASPASGGSMNSKPPKPISSSTAHLYMTPAEESDVGLYWCRVDYKWERTTISTVSLNVIVPPRHLQIMLKPDSSYGLSSQSVLPLTANQTITLNEDDSATLLCLSEGGNPLPILNWYRNDELIRRQIFHSLTESNRTLQSELHLTQIRPADHNVLLRCLSSNDNHTFMSSHIRLRVNSKPSRVQVNLYSSGREVNHSIPLSLGSEITAQCLSFGSRPAANHTWSLAPSDRHLRLLEQDVYVESQLESNEESEELDSEEYSEVVDAALVTKSLVRLVVQAEDHGHHLVCNAHNDRLDPKRSALAGSLKLNIAFAPRVTLMQSRSASGNSSHLAGGLVIRGQSLHLQCNISANPAADRILWYRNSVPLIPDSNGTGSNIFEFAQNGTRLIVNKVTDEWQGFYQCVAHNTIGSGFSNQFQMQVLFRPRCVTPTQTIPANVGSVVTMICEVDANPTNVTFHWRTKHNELEGKYEPSRLHRRHMLRNRLEVRIESTDDFGQYSCWAHNLAGSLEEPCFYNIYENPIKQQLICETNISYKVIQVECQADSVIRGVVLPTAKSTATQSTLSFNVSQPVPRTVHFNLKIYKDKKQLINLTSSEPRFLLHVSELRQSELRTGDTAGPEQASREMNDFTEPIMHEGQHRNESLSLAATTVPTDSVVSRDALAHQSLHYQMLISALVDGRLTSDVSLSFKVPAIEPEPSIYTDFDFDVLDTFLSAPNNLSISSYKNYPTLASPKESQHQHQQESESKKTNAASFTTAATIRQLPLIWTCFTLIVISLIVFILVTLARVYQKRRRRRKPSNEMVQLESNECNACGDGDGRGKTEQMSSKDFLIEEEDNGKMNDATLDEEKESIKLFTLANFDHVNSYSIGIGDQPPPTSELHDFRQQTPLSSSSRHVNLRQALPDLMTDTFNYDTAVAAAFGQMETSQHNLYIIRNPSTTNLVSSASHLQHQTSGATINQNGNNSVTGTDTTFLYGTLPGARHPTQHITMPHSMFTVMPLEQVSAPSAEATELSDWSY